MASRESKDSGRHSRLRRARKDWIKGNRERATRIDPEGDTAVGGHERMRPRGIAFDEFGDVESLMRGQVVLAQSGRYDVRFEDGTTLSCRVKRGASTENEGSTLVVIGDFVRVQSIEEGRGLIHHIEERRTHLGRTRLGRDAGGGEGMELVIAANVDLLLCVVDADRPDFRRTIIDRFIVVALLGEIVPVIVVNKMDTVGPEVEELLREDLEIYDRLDYRTIYVSATTGLGMDELREAIDGSVSVLAGHSGVGKSTIANVILGESVRRTGEVRRKDRRGTHTTIDSVMLTIPTGGYLIDTPGLRELGIWDLEPEELDGYFVEFLDYLQDCKYLPCTHTHEPGCAVIAAVERGEIDEGRYASYLSIFESLRQAKAGGR